MKYLEENDDGLQKPKHGQVNSTDRLSDLPDFIIHHIISYMDTRDAYRTSVLSKRWNQIFATNPILDIYYKFPMEYIDTRMQKFSKENLRITKFRLVFRVTYDLLLPCKVDEWLEIAVHNQVAEIELNHILFRGNYKLPSILFCAKSLRHLRCVNIKIPYYEAVELVSLKSLHLLSVVVEERMLFHIVSSCLLLKDLLLSDCTGYKNLVIPRRSTLEYLYIDGEVPEDGRVILETSSLRTFKYYTKGVNPWPIISNRGLLKNMRFLSVSDLSITDKAFAELLPELASLEKLEFLGCHMLTSIKISNTQLKQICLYDCYTLSNAVIDAPSLKKFKFDGEIVPSLSITVSSQANCSIYISTMPSNFNTDGFFKLKKLLKGLDSCNVLKIVFRNKYEYGEDGIDFDEEENGNAELGPPCDIRELKLNLYLHWELSSSSLSAFFNGLFWICHPPLISLRVNSGHHKLKVEPLVNKLVDMVKCLSHPLKRIEVEETNNDVQLRLCW